jgi:hypothetical protein
VLYAAASFYVDVDISGCGFDAAPVVLASMGGNEGHGQTTGSSAVYSITSTGFRIWIYGHSYISWNSTSQINSREWHIEWRARDAGFPGYRNGVGRFRHAGCAGRNHR